MYQLNPLFENVARRLYKDPKLAQRIFSDPDLHFYDLAHTIRAKQRIGKKLKPYFTKELKDTKFIPQGEDAITSRRLRKDIESGWIKPSDWLPTMNFSRPGWQKRSIRITKPRSEKFEKLLQKGEDTKNALRNINNNLSSRHPGSSTPLDRTISKRRPGIFKKMADDKLWY